MRDVQKMSVEELQAELAELRKLPVPNVEPLDSPLAAQDERADAIFVELERRRIRDRST